MSEREQLEQSLVIVQNRIADYTAQEMTARMARIRYMHIKADLEKKLEALNANQQSKT